MIFLVDSCALSEPARPRPPPVCAWFEAAPPEALFVSVLTLGEIRRGIGKLAGGRRRARLTLVTRSEAAFAATGVALLNPWRQ